MSVAEVVLAGVDPSLVEVQEREILGPHIFVRAGAYVLSIVGEIDLDSMIAARPEAYGPNPGPLPLRSDEVEIGLLSADHRNLVAEPLRHLPFEVAAAICRAALAGDVDAFRPFYADDLS